MEPVADDSKGREISYRYSVFLVLLAGVCWSSFGVGVRLIQEANVWQILLYRSIALAPLLIAVIAIRNRWNAWGAVRRTGLAGIIGGIALVFAFSGGIYSIQHTTVANAMFLFAAAPFAAAVLGKIVLKENVRRGTFFSMLFAIVGIAIMVWEGINIGHLAGNLAALISALGFAVFTVALRWRRVEDTMPTVFLAGVLSMLFAAVVCFLQGTGFVIPPNDVLVCFVMGLVQVGVGLICYTIGARKVPAAELALLSMTEVVFGPIWTWLFMDETAGIFTLFGGVILLMAIATNALTGLRRKPIRIL